jgi:site-specific recombinase XerD
MNKSDKPILKHIPDFLDYCEIERGLSDNTQKNYSRYLNKFHQWLKAVHKEGLKPHELTPEDIWNYRLYLARFKDPKTNKVLSKLTQNYYLIALRSVLTYFSDKDIISLPADKIQLPKDARKEKTVKFLTLEQIEKLLLTPNVETKEGLRDRAILEVLFSTGLRIAELTSLNLEQFKGLGLKKDLELGVIGKGKHPRTVYFSERALEWLKKYLKSRSDNDKALFTHFRTKMVSEGRLTPRSVERIVKKYATLANIPYFTTPHTLRHSMATDLLNKGVDIRIIQEFLGHRNISTTQIYTHVTNKRLGDIHRQFHSGKELKN